MNTTIHRRGLRGLRTAFPGLLLALVCALLGASPLRAQEGAGRPGDPPGRRMDAETRIREYMDERIREELGLTPEAYAEVREVMDEFSGRRREVAGQKRATNLRIQAWRQDGGREGEAERLLKELSDLYSMELLLFQEEQEALAQHLTPDQQLRYFFIREQLRRRVEQLRGRMGGGPPGGTGGIDDLPRLP